MRRLPISLLLLLMTVAWGCNAPRAAVFIEPDMTADEALDAPPPIVPVACDDARPCAQQPNASARCEEGVCGYECAQGWSDPDNVRAAQGCLCDLTMSTCGGPAVCGDSIVSGEEQCDEGAQNSDEAPDACRTSCEAAACGDAVVDDGEQCDDGNDDDTDGCTTACTPCGNGVIDDGEQCDDGQVPPRDGDGCSSTCQLEPLWACSDATPSQCWRQFDPGNEVFEDYGYKVKLSGHWLFVSARSVVADGGGRQGRVDIYKETGGSWSLHQQLKGTSFVADDEFGSNLTMLDDSTIIISAPRADVDGVSNVGRVYVYVLNADVWTLSDTIDVRPENAQANIYFGTTVAYNRRYSRIVFGVSHYDLEGKDGVGATFNCQWDGIVCDNRFSRPQNSEIDDLEAGAGYGGFISIDGDYMAVSANGALAQFQNNSTKGRVYLYGPGPTVVLNPNFAGNTDMGFGAGLLIKEDTVLVGAIGYQNLSGAMFAFDLNGTLLQSFLPPSQRNALWSYSFDIFEGELFLSGLGYNFEAIVGVGAVMRIKKAIDGMGWDWEGRALIRPPVNVLTGFGTSISVDSGRIAVGAPRYQLGSNRRGAAFLIDLPN